MREAALKAEIAKKLIIALEPEAASVYCRSLDVTEQGQSTFKAGTKYLVIDAGGGTVDLTVHKVLRTGGVKEIHTASGGAWGGTQVDKNFAKLLEDVFGIKFITTFQQQCPQQWLHLMVSFEKVKRSAKPDPESKITIPIPMVMATKCKDICRKTLEKVIEKAKKPGLSFANGLLILKYEVVVSLFQPVIDEIVSHIDNLVRGPGISGCSHFMLVGGFAVSALLQKAIIEKFETWVKVLIPKKAQMSVIKGAVLFGHNPDEIEIRKARKCYGILTKQKFDPAIHDEEHKFLAEGVARCDHIFSMLVKKGDDIKVGETIDNTYHPVYHNQTVVEIQLYESDNPNVKYVVEQGCKRLGKLTVAMPNVEKDLDREVKLEMTFGGTEIQVEAHDVESGCRAEATIDFLCD